MAETARRGAQPRRGVLVVELKAMIKDLLFSEEEEEEKPLLGFAKMNGSQLTDKARQLQIPTSEREPHEVTADQNTTGRPHEADNTAIKWDSACTERSCTRRVLQVNH